jgi:hypothetical protein
MFIKPQLKSPGPRHVSAYLMTYWRQVVGTDRHRTSGWGKKSP